MASHDASDPPGPRPAEDGEASIGAYLARQRRLRGISLDELEIATRVPLRSLERLEAGAFDSGNDGFSRGFVKTVAFALGLDPDETLARMLVEPDARAHGATRAGARLAWVGLTGAALAAVGAFVWLGRGGDSGPRPSAEPLSVESELVYRRDPVRELAESVLPEEATQMPPARPRDASRPGAARAVARP